ncbi:MAG TPA: DNA translocase FtsK 4TM domain-containing protein, partial [Vicinamibacterales bacterium]|nr:DNA translocase FtsK 4TM domain-containing protein [Vicinamibacterales bacterium]
MSELTGVVLFASMVMWLIALVSYTPADPAWFFNNVTSNEVANFAGRVGAFVAELSFQLLGYSAYLIPAALSLLGWQAFWCRKVDAAYTKLIGLGLVFMSSAALLSLAFSFLEVTGRPFAAGGVLGEAVAGLLSSYLNRTGAAILLITVVVLSVILATHFSLGRASEAAAGAVRDHSTGI